MLSNPNSTVPMDTFNPNRHSIDAAGLIVGERHEPPDRAQVEVCKDFILAYGRPSKNLRRTLSSYGLKHLVEVWSRRRGTLPYVTNGSFLQAAMELGVRFHQAAPGSRNAYLAMSFERYQPEER